MFLNDIIEEHAEEAAFLWSQRQEAAYSLSYDLGDVLELDDRLEGNLEGLRVAGRRGWEACLESFAWEDPGEVFVGSILALESGEEGCLPELGEFVGWSLASARGLASALGWLELPKALQPILSLVASDNPAERYGGIGGAAVHRHDLGTALKRGLEDDTFWVKARALRAAGELGRLDLMPEILQDIMSEDESCRFAAAWSAALFGDLTGIAILKSFADSRRYQDRAIQMAFRCMPTAVALAWRDELAAGPEFARLGTQGAGAMGDPVAVPWLLQRMAVPELARSAGEAFSMITGVDLANENLGAVQSKGFQAGPTEDPEDDNVEPHPDDDLPWPDPDGVAQWWSVNRQRFQVGSRYLAGRLVARDELRVVLRTGNQRQRAAAALELAIISPGTPLFEVRERSDRQSIRLR